MKNPPWDGGEVARWFAQRATGAGVPKESQRERVEQKGMLLSVQVRDVQPSWVEDPVGREQLQAG